MYCRVTVQLNVDIDDVKVDWRSEEIASSYNSSYNSDPNSGFDNDEYFKKVKHYKYVCACIYSMHM